VTSVPILTTAVIARRGVRVGAITAIACVAQFMVVLDTSIVNVALPSMRTALGLSPGQQQWVVTGYLITFGGLLLLAARAGDLFGWRRVFLCGLVVFTAASLLGALAPNATVLLSARLIQGVGAAALAPASLSLITASHPDPRQRAHALSYWTAASSSAGAAGMVLGGILTTGLDWRWIFIVNVPIGVALAATSVVFLARSAPATGQAGLDVLGAVTATAGTGLLVFGISQATDAGWDAVEVIASLAAAAVLLAAFVVVESRVSAPLVPLRIFRHPNLTVANLSGMLLGATMTAMFYFLSLYLQLVLGYSALRTGLALVPWTVALVAGVFIARRLLQRVAARMLLLAGAFLTACGLAWLSTFPTHDAYLSHIAGPTVIAGVGFSVMVLPITIAATHGIPPNQAGLASGLLNASRQIGGAIGLAVLATIASGVATRTAGDTLHRLVDGYRIAILAAGGLILFAAACGAFLRTPTHTETELGTSS
jgi:EmrB/QacA subfamily drug resistance transporter